MSLNLESRPFTIVLRVLSFAPAGLFLWYSVQWMPRLTHGFAMYYTYSRTVLDGGSLTGLYDVDRFNAAMRTFGFGDIVDMPNNIPTTALAALPVAWLDPVRAKQLWTFILLISYGLSLVLLLRAFDIGIQTPPGLLLVTFAFLFRPAYENICFGQVYIILLLCFSYCLLAIKNQKGVIQIAVSASIPLLLKGYGVPALLWFGATRRWRHALVIIGMVLLVIAVTIPMLQVGAWIAFDENVLSSLGMLPRDAHVAYQTINGFLFHLFTFDPQWLPNPLFELPSSFVRVLSYLANGLVVAAVLQRGRYASPMLGFAAAIAASVITAPLAEEHHFVLFLPLLFGLLAIIYREYLQTKVLTLVHGICLLSAVVLALPIPYERLQFASPPLVILGYPKLLFGLILLSCFAWLTRGARGN